VYEELIGESRAQTRALTLIIGTLETMTVFEWDNYETLVSKCLVHASRLLKRVDQARMIILASHLFWSKGVEGGDGGKKNGKRVLDCMQKALKIADMVIERDVCVELFVDVLERCVWFFENKAETVRHFPSYFVRSR
jgi:vacuolar protein sorting-associated protein 35